MGLVNSRLNLEGLRPGRRRSQQEETLYSYSLNKNYFSNYFLMGGERFEVNDPDYLFGDNCDLNFLTCTKPYSLPYKKAQQNLLVHLNNKQKAMNKVSSRVNSLSTPLNILAGRSRQVSQSRKQGAQTQTLNKSPSNGQEPSRPLIMLINIRKETLRLVRSSNVHNIDSDQNSLMTNNNATPERRLEATRVPAVQAGSLASNKSQRRGDSADDELDGPELGRAKYYSRANGISDSSSVTSNTLSSAQSTVTSKSGGYTSVKDAPPSDCASDENDECYQDALNEPTNLSMKGEDDDDDSDSLQDQAKNSTKENLDIRITIKSNDQPDCAPNYDCDTSGGFPHPHRVAKTRGARVASVGSNGGERTNAKRLAGRAHQVANRVYNIEFTFDAEVDCSIRIFYFCTREVSSSNVSYKPQHATYKSKTYTYKRGLNQRFEQHEHTFQPYLFDEDLLIYKPLDMDGNYNSGAVFPIVIHMAALEGPAPRQSQSLVATVEKSQLDDSYSIKALKQLIFVDGVQYILQDIYGIENRPLTSPQSATVRSSSRAPKLSRQGNLRSSCASLNSTSNLGSNLNLSDTASIASVVESNAADAQDGDSSLVTNKYKSLGSDNTFECVICMSDERDTMLLPCRHLCLCSSCAQSLRYQASSCPICRCPFKAALNLRVIQRSRQRRSWSANVSNEALETQETSVKRHPELDPAGVERYQASVTTIVRRESITSPATPLLPQGKSSSTASASDALDDPRGEQAVVSSRAGARSERPKSKSASVKSSPHHSSARESTDSRESAAPVDRQQARARLGATDDRAANVALEMQAMRGEGGEPREVTRS